VILLLLVSLVLIGVAVALVTSAILEPRIRRSENLSQVEAYGYRGLASTERRAKQTRATFDDLVNWMGDLVGNRILSVRESDLQRELISAGIYRITPRKFIGYRALFAIGLPIVLVWFFALAGAATPIVVLMAVVGFVGGWVGPIFLVHRLAARRLQRLDEMLPSMIDLLVVTLEAGVAFPQAMRLAAERLDGPLGDELRLTIQEQALGLSVLESLENWLLRCDTSSVRGFVRAMIQGDRLGVSIAQILRHQAIEVRARQRAMVQERAQKAPIKILFPLVFLIFPAMFVIILAPALLQITKVLHT
jgi:tight adherence protein C